MERRELLKMIAAATGMAMIGIPAFVHGQSPVPEGQGSFSDDEVAMLDEVAETILPRTDTPGARDAGVGAFMARYVTDCLIPEDQATFRAGLADLDKRAGGSFVAMARDARAELLRALDAEARAQSGAGGMPHYFTMIKQLVIFGFFTSEVGATQVLRYVAVPGYYDGDMTYEPGTPAWAT
ncbi:MAG: gluconate 2-dehydrogenase subunit 3 family protein [Pseudoxanthomonas sp.]